MQPTPPTRLAAPTAAARLAGVLVWLVLAPTASGQDPTPPAPVAPPPPPAPGTAATYRFTVTERLPVTASSTFTIPAEDFELRPLESGGQMLEAVPALITAQHTGGGKAEQYFLRGFDADHGTDLAVFFDGVPINLRSHAHGQGFLDLHFVTKETIERMDAHKGPYFPRYGDFATAAAIDYVPFDRFDESFAKFEIGEWSTRRWVGGFTPRWGPFAEEGRADALVSFEAYTTDGPFRSDENLERYSILFRGAVDLTENLRISGHGLGYWADWRASGLVPEMLVDDGTLSRFGSIDPTEGGDSARGQGKLQLDWSPSSSSHLTAFAYLAYYDLELFSNFTYFLVNDDPDVGDGIVQRDDGRLYGGGRVEYVHLFDTAVPARLTGGLESRYDDAEVVLGTQTRRTVTGTTAADRIHQLSVEPYVEAELIPLDWVRLMAGLRFAWFHFDGEDLVTDTSLDATSDSVWLPKANLVLSPFGAGGPLECELRELRELELFVNFGIGYHSNDARAVFADSDATTLPKATGFEVGARTELFERIELALNWWYLNLEDEFVFVGDEGTTESAGETDRQGVEFVATAQVLEWLYLRGDVAYTDARLAGSHLPVAQAPRFVAKAALGVRWEGLAAELGVRSFGDRYASEEFYDPKLSGYTVVDFGVRYRWRFLEVGFAMENLTDTKWRSSEFFYESRPIAGGLASEDFHFTPGNPRNVRGWVAARF
jgi:hypothetical protein